MEPENPLLDDFVLGLARRQLARVCLLPTASADSPTLIARFYRAMSARCVATDVTVVGGPGLPRQPARTEQIAAVIAEQDVLYVGGGNTAHLLALWRLHGIHRAVRAAWEGGAVLAGLSAGTICRFDASLTDSFGGLEPLRDGLGLLPGSACPHYDGEAERRPTYHRLVAAGFPARHAADDGAALHFEGKDLIEVVSSRPRAAAYRVALEGGAVVETKIPTRYLGR